MINHRYCCGNLNAVFQFSIRPVTDRTNTHWKRAVYQCKICKEYTVRADTDQLESWNTKITIINQEEFNSLYQERKEYEQRITQPIGQI